MELARLPHDPNALADFYVEALGTLGAVVERSWHDRLDIIAEGAAARLWNPNGAWHETELRFLPREETGERNALADVFPGCPLTFRLAEVLTAPPSFDRIILASEVESNRPPAREVLERLWRVQHPDTQRCQVVRELRPARHFSLVGIFRCEIQAIDQHWSLHRLAVSLPGGEPDHGLENDLQFARPERDAGPQWDWPELNLGQAMGWFRDALLQDLGRTLAGIRSRQGGRLRKELGRIDAYFAAYEQELAERRTRGAEAEVRRDQRLAAARIERARRIADQTSRHAIHVFPRMDGLLLLAEPAWLTTVEWIRQRSHRSTQALFVPRSRAWHALAADHHLEEGR